MARKRADGKRGPGVQSKKGKLYVLISETVIDKGSKKYRNRWIATSLDDTYENVKKALKFRELLLNAKHLGSFDANTTVPTYVDAFLSAKERTIANTTYAAYTQRCQPIKEFFATIKVRDINKVRVESFLDYLAESGKYKLRTLKDIRSVFNSIMSEAVKDGLITFNPVSEAQISKSILERNVKADKNGDDFFTYQEAETFLSYVKSHELFEFFYITLFFGLRRSEALGLKWSAFNLEAKEFVINHTVTKGTQVNRLNTTKTASSKRTYPLTDEQVSMLLALKETESSNKVLFGNKYHDNDYVFKHPDGSLYHPDYPSKAFRKIINRHPDLPQKITLHGLRASCVSILVHANCDLKSIQNWVGQKDINTTLKYYTKVKSEEAKKEISAGMQKVIHL